MRRHPRRRARLPMMHGGLHLAAAQAEDVADQELGVDVWVGDAGRVEQGRDSRGLAQGAGRRSGSCSTRLSADVGTTESGARSRVT